MTIRWDKSKKGEDTVPLIGRETKACDVTNAVSNITDQLPMKRENAKRKQHMGWWPSKDTNKKHYYIASLVHACLKRHHMPPLVPVFSKNLRSCRSQFETIKITMVPPSNRTCLTSPPISLSRICGPNFKHSSLSITSCTKAKGLSLM